MESAVDITTTGSFYISTTSEERTFSQTSITSDQSTTETSTTPQTSTISSLATVITSQATESTLGTSSQVTTETQPTTTSTSTETSAITTIQTSGLSTLGSLTSSTITTTSTPTSKSGSTTSHANSQTVSCSSTSAYISVNPGSEIHSASGSAITTTSSAVYTMRTVYQTLTKDLTYTKTVFAETVTTATYLTVDQSNHSLVSTCVPVTLLYSACHCKEQIYPNMSMTTIVSPCSACGPHGESTVTLTVPEAACETGSGSYNHPKVQFPNGWTGAYQTDQHGSSYLEAKFTAKPQGGPQNTKGQPSIPTPTAESYNDSQPGKNGYLPAPVATAGSQNNSPGGNSSYPHESAQPKINDEPRPTQGGTAQATFSASQSGNRLSPSLSSDISHIQGFSTSLTKEVATSSVVQALKPTGSGEAQTPDTPPMVVSGANSPHAISWTMMGAMIATILLLK
ncbi:hypothetical protein FHETE_831 [Fusarium heterosporum]|uniref:Uncharacterized protein n=1 Tax=Fusarium heterosporum TaxID=42747 RepID=A0A8H5X348_FUSHE|nr:hypothetical protein FHETE_831 [Fusarium heterosporum]